MKAFILATLVSAVLVQAGPVPPEVQAAVEKRQALGYLTTLLGKGGKVADPPGAAPKKQVMKSDSVLPNVKRVKMRYGPYSVPNMNKTGLTGEAGALWNYPDTGIPKPCTECTIVSQQAGLEYPNGDNANIDTGMWLHHMVHFTIGPGRSDPTCFGRSSLPHVDVGTSPSNGERYFSSGNERTRIMIDKRGAATDFGYHLRTNDKFAFIVDLMNMNMEDKTVYLTMTYDIIEGPLPPNWRELKTVWFDANQCGTSEVAAVKQTGSYTITARPWKANFEGEIIGVGGHLHDGGVDLQILSGEQQQCNSVAQYGERPEYLFRGKMGAMANYADKHISSMSACYNEALTVRQLVPGQVWTIKARYDYDKFPGNRDHAGKQESVMAIALMYVAVKPGSVQLGGASSAPAAPGAPAAPAAPGAPGAAGPPMPRPKGVKGLPKQPRVTPGSAPPEGGA
ncbi:hypothetical protein EJ06DRAFT_552503 [Trichodelitschia bisporula]|uniref:Uncharacterized protein n=1 Tax=Trichodelitschia bisporula TaxID=703511 RepID=A0A6G1IA48_9PEZI|nr:hypothetical protein EJ06DRAFT_552503 [Trichodelitschia bisporula]